MKRNIIKGSLSILVVSLLMCLMFVSCKSTSEELPAKGEVVQDTTDKKEEVNENEVTNPKEEVKEEVKVEEEIPQLPPENENIEVKEEDTYGEMICIVNNVYLSNNKKYVDVDQVEFFTGEEAYIEAGKDGKLYKDENGNDFLPSGYYIRNNYNTVETYEVSEGSIFNLCMYIVEPSSTGNSSDIMPVSYEEFEMYINNSTGVDQRSRMFWINTKNDIVESVEMQYTP